MYITKRQNTNPTEHWLIKYHTEDQMSGLLNVIHSGRSRGASGGSLQPPPCPPPPFVNIL